MSTAHAETFHHWRDRALCAGRGDLYFAPDTTRDHPGRWSETTPKQVCRRCPVRAECLDYAIDNDIYDGVWGGMNPGEREKYAKCRAKARRTTGASE